MSISSAELAALLGALGTVKTIKEFEFSIRSAFQAEKDQIRACMSLCVLISDGVITSDAEILLSQWLLVRLFHPTAENPFLPHLFDLLQEPSPAHALVIRLLLRQFGSATATEQKQLDRFLNLPIDQVLQECQAVPFNIQEYTQQLLGLSNAAPIPRPLPSSGLCAFGVRPVAVRIVLPAHSPIPNSAEAAAVLQLGAGEEGFETALQPMFPVFEPPLHAPIDMRWMDPQEPVSIVYDHSLVDEGCKQSVLKDLFEISVSSALTQTQVSTLLRGISEDPNALRAISVTPTNLPGLVEHNPALASELLVRVVKHMPPVSDSVAPDTGNDTTKLLYSLLSIDMSLHSMEVVSHLSIHCRGPDGLPKSFLCAYIANCIVYCENVRDKYLQNRLVRLLCVFLQSLIRNKILSGGEAILSEVQTFCVEFTKIREANGLFKLLKSLEATAGIS